MRILIEEHQYQAEQIRDVLHGIDAMQDIDGNVSIRGCKLNCVKACS